MKKLQFLGQKASRMMDLNLFLEACHLNKTFKVSGKFLYPISTLLTGRENLQPNLPQTHQPLASYGVFIPAHTFT
ncbi:hypothetical protein EXN66_Car016476 [Channa argus]|uniref:Uncharacterized protein n=1 Tax=Channa argus TaxID=215402 RepID=A0A6G1QEX8_CHAAH|nr:hypothetical protein EXN66_Car016476 [Channa argus]